eukprot:178988-Hanusia_phi.AAC.1
MWGTFPGQWRGEEVLSREVSVAGLARPSIQLTGARSGPPRPLSADGPYGATEPGLSYGACNRNRM